MLWFSNSPRKKKNPPAKNQGQPYIWIFIFSFQVSGIKKLIDIDLWEGFHGRGGPPTMEIHEPSLPWNKGDSMVFCHEKNGSLFLYLNDK